MVFQDLETVMIMAAGFGTRMGPLTQEVPKPLVPLSGKPLIEYIFDWIFTKGCEKPSRVVINAHYLADKIAEYIDGKQDGRIQISREEGGILETGGGIKNALPMIASDVFFVVNPDSMWLGECPFCALKSNWDADKMDCLMLLVPKGKDHAHSSEGDVKLLDSEGRIRFRNIDDNLGARYIYSGLQIIKAKCFKDFDESFFPLVSVWDAIASQNQLYGTVYPSEWVDIGTPLGIKTAESLIG